MTYTQYYEGKESEKEYMCIYACVCVCVYITESLCYTLEINMIL